VDPVDIVGLTRALVDIDSTTGREGAVGRWLADYLRGRAYAVTEQPVDDTRFNVIAAPSSPAGPLTAEALAKAVAIVFSTHIDCVPPFFPSRIEGDRLHGRGACDAKGILAAQVAAADRLRADGESRVGLVFVVGEERGSDGARRANEAAGGSRFLVDASRQTTGSAWRLGAFCA
jgi:acetylornithine deacetylase